LNQPTCLHVWSTAAAATTTTANMNDNPGKPGVLTFGRQAIWAPMIVR